MGSGLTKKAVEQAAASSAKTIGDGLLNVLDNMGSGADYMDDFQDDLEEKTNKALEDSTKQAKKGLERFIDTLFYDYIVESPWFKKEWKEKYEAAKKSAIRWADYGPPYREDSNQELLEELADMNADVMVVHRCLMDKANPNFTEAKHDSNTALHYCCQNGHDTSLTMLLKAGADVNAINKMHQTPLILAAAGKQKKHVNMVKTLVRHGAKINAKDKAGNTALINTLLVMTTEHTVEIVRFLLKHGATTYIKPKYLTVPDPDPVEILAERIEQQDAVQLLQGRVVVRGPRLLWTSDEKLHELFRVRQEVAKRHEQLDLESQQNSASVKAAKLKHRAVVRQKNLDKKKTRAYARVLAREEAKWDAMRETVESYAEDEMRRHFTPNKCITEGEKEWKKESAMTWVVHGRAGQGPEISEQEKRLAIFNKRLQEFKSNLKHDPTSV